MTCGQCLPYNLIYNAAVFVYDGKYVVVRAGLRPHPACTDVRKPVKRRYGIRANPLSAQRLYVAGRNLRLS